MILIDVGSESKQQIQVPFSDGTATIRLYFSSFNSCWFMSVSYGTNTVNNILIEYGVIHLGIYFLLALYVSLILKLDLFL